MGLARYGNPDETTELLGLLARERADEVFAFAAPKKLSRLRSFAEGEEASALVLGRQAIQEPAVRPRVYFVDKAGSVDTDDHRCPELARGPRNGLGLAEGVDERNELPNGWVGHRSLLVLMV
jgi:hypothetical protein